MLNEIDDYSQMQRKYYDDTSSKWNPSNDWDWTVGSFNWHNSQTAYEKLFHGLDLSLYPIALDFGCGPGRTMTLYWNRFKRIDGADICPGHFKNAREWLSINGIDSSIPNFYQTDGKSLKSVPLDFYNIIYSTICLQHICVWNIRMNIFRDMFKVLKSGGILTFQALSGKNPQEARWRENRIDIDVTNGTVGSNCTIEDPKQVKEDFESLGFEWVRHEIVTLPDYSPDWIFIMVKKP